MNVSQLFYESNIVSREMITRLNNCNSSNLERTTEEECYSRVCLIFTTIFI